LLQHGLFRFPDRGEGERISSEASALVGGRAESGRQTEKRRRREVSRGPRGGATSDSSAIDGRGRPGGRVVTPLSEVELAERFLTALRVFALRRLRDPTEAEDVAQEAMARVVAALRQDRLLDREALPAFVFETASHVCQHRLRKLGRQGRAYGRLAAEGGATGVEAGALARMLGRERRQLVRSALARLGTADRELLRRLYFADEPPASVAQDLGIQEGALRVRRHRALRRLRRILEVGGAADSIDLDDL